MFAAGEVTTIVRTLLTVTVTAADVRVFGVPVFSVATAAIVKVPGADGVQFTENGATVSVPTETPFTRKSTCVIDALPELAFALAESVIVLGELSAKSVPSVGAVMVTLLGWVAKAAGTTAHASNNRVAEAVAAHR